MNVLYICADRGIPVLGNKGASVHVRSLTTAMQKLGHRVTLVARRWDHGNPPPRVHRVERLREDPDDAADQLERLIRTKQPDVVIERYSLQSGAGRVATRRCGLALTLEVNAPLAREATRYRGLDDPSAEQRERETFQAADRIHVVSPALWRYVRSVAPEVPAAWIPNGADVARFRAAPPAVLASMSGRVVVGFVGSMKPWHGVDRLLEAFARVRPHYPQAALLLVGAGPSERELIDRANRVDLRGGVVRTGQLSHDRVRSLIGRFDIAVAPYPPVEGFYFHPLKVVEYLAAGKAVIYSDQGDLRALVGSGGLGYAPSSVDRLADRLAQLLGDAALRRDLAASAAARGARLDWSAVADRVVRFAGGAPDPAFPDLLVDRDAVAGEAATAGSAVGGGTVSSMQADPPRAGVAAPKPAEEPANPYVFVVGAARSGTTLLQRMLDAHPLLAVVNETYWLARKFWERAGLTPEGLVTPALLPMLLASPRFPRMGVTEEDLRRLLSEEQPVRYDRFVERIFDLYAARRGKQLAGDETPGYVRRIRQLHELWPSARFVHIIRDPRDLYLSMLDWSGGERTAGRFGTWEMDPAISTALYWRWSVAVGREAGETLGPSLYHEVRYEDLVASPDRELVRICEFLRLPYAAAMTRFHEARTPRKPGGSSKAQWLAPTVGLRDWRTQLPSGDVERTEAAAGELLRGLGYASRFGHCSPAVRDHVAQVRETVTRYLLAHGRMLPRDW